MQDLAEINEAHSNALKAIFGNEKGDSEAGSRPQSSAVTEGADDAGAGDGDGEQEAGGDNNDDDAGGDDDEGD